ncbi:MFS transporter [Nocardioides massiliensis]|uniref:Fucose permease n=1 Tax=Nocardioides massiliensis TaxID=1325935 RepID=A0ABT9NU48_9ACTN|nr:MFS transporter [Nocardioides massiliensis]MDP9823831.1 fucose permease [Nocardioides massiliensis]
MSAPAATIRAARNGTGWVFVLNGLCFATWVSRLPQARRALELDNAQLGLLLLALAVGSMIALPLTGALIERVGVRIAVRAGLVAAVVGLSCAAVAISDGVPVDAARVLAAAGLFVYGAGSGAWDVAMNVEAAEVERGLGRTVMPRFHAGFSIGTVAGAGLGAAAIALGVPAPVHVGLVLVLSVGVLLPATGAFVPVGGAARGGEGPPGSSVSVWRAWTEPRTLLIGAMVMALALMEGTANDWLALALVDGHGFAEASGVAGYAGFVAAMTLGRLVGPAVLDRGGRTAVLWGTLLCAAAGIALVVTQDGPLIALGILLWGLGASLGFPVGMSAAADDPVRSAARVSVVSTLGYTAFLAGPPAFGALAETVGTLEALWALAILTLPAALLVPAARPRDAPA